MSLRVETLVTGSFVENGYAVWNEDDSRAVVIDPGAESDRWVAWVEDAGLDLVHVLATHCHLDHVGAVAALQRRFDSPFSIHADEREMLENLPVQCQMFGHPPIQMPQQVGHLHDGDAVQDAGFDVAVLATPGHTPGGASFYVPALKTVFTGDTLFAGSIGRTDLPGGTSELLLQSLRSLCQRLPDETIVRPGHGPETTIGRERQSNPFFRVEREA